MPPKKKNKTLTHRGVVARNRRASYDYELGDSLEAGLVLLGSEVKSLRAGDISLAQAFIGDKEGELYLLNARIGEYAPASGGGHEPGRARKLLLAKHQRDRLIAQSRQDGMTLVPPLALLQRPGQGQALPRTGQGQAQARQARDDQTPRMVAPQEPNPLQTLEGHRFRALGDSLKLGEPHPYSPSSS